MSEENLNHSPTPTPKPKITRKKTKKAILAEAQAQQAQAQQAQAQQAQAQVETQSPLEAPAQVEAPAQAETSNIIIESNIEAVSNVKIPKKRGRKPKGGKIVPNNVLSNDKKILEPNIIMHLKCGETDIAQNAFSSSLTYEPNVPPVETFQFDNTKSNDLGFSIIDYGAKDLNKSDNIPQPISTTITSVNDVQKTTLSNDNDEQKQLWNKLKELTYQLHTNSISDKKSACFWCTYDFDNPTILIPKYELNKIYQCYGCFCSPECATAYLFEESVDTSTRFERYHLLNHIYCKIYNYDKNIKPAPNPYYTLNKYYGNLSIQEYRKLLKNERLLLIVDKPLSRVLPELHEDNDDYMFNGATISTSNKFKLRRKTKQTKTDILSDTFNLKS